MLPIIQSGPLFIAEEEAALSTLFESFRNDANAVIDLTSGYFGLYEDYQQYVLRSKARWRILAASPKVWIVFVIPLSPSDTQIRQMVFMDHTGSLVGSRKATHTWNTGSGSE